MTDYAIRELVCAITMQAVKDYVSGDKAQKRAVLHDLRSPYMEQLTNGMSSTVALQLELHPDAIAERMRKYKEQKEN